MRPFGTTWVRVVALCAFFAPLIDTVPPGMAAFLRGSEYYEAKKLLPANIQIAGTTLSAKLKGHGAEVRLI